MSGLVLGVDSGGTKTVAALVAPDATVASLRRLPSLDPTADGDWAAEIASLAAQVGEADLRSSAFGLPFHGEVDEYTEAQIAAVRLHFRRSPSSRTTFASPSMVPLPVAPGRSSSPAPARWRGASLGEVDSPHIRGWMGRHLR